MKTPRWYQAEARDAVLNYTGDKGAMVVLPTGTGKSLVTCLVVEEIVKQGGRAICIAESHELTMNMRQTFEEQCPGHHTGYAGAGLDEDLSARVIFGKKKSLASPIRMSCLLSHGEFRLEADDECHHAPAAEWTRVHKNINPKLRMGTTATPDRADDKRMSDDWDIVYSLPIVQAQEEGFILPIWSAMDKVPDLDLSKVKSTRRDYDDGAQEEALLKAHIVEHTVSALRRLQTFQRLPLNSESRSLVPNSIPGGAIVYCVTINHAERTLEALREAGWGCEILHSKMKQRDQNSVVHALRNGTLDMAVNVIKLGEGVDIPRVQLGVLARATRVWSLYMQMCGRFVRQHGDQDAAYILDLVGASSQHSIVSAPVLVDGKDCLESADGRHYFLPMASGEGRCQHCQQTIKCYARRGGHRFVGGSCVSCGASQCPDSPNNEHDYFPSEPGIRTCAWCGDNHSDPLTSLVGRANPPRLPIRWVKLELPQEIYAAHLGDVGMLYNVHHHGGAWLPYWVHGESCFPLSGNPVSQGMSRLLLQDVARRAQKVRGYIGGFKKHFDMKRQIRELAQAQRQHELWRNA